MRSLFLLTALCCSALLSALEITPSAPEEGAVMPLLNAGQKAYLTMPREERVKFFADSKKRKELVKCGHHPLPVTLAWQSDAPANTEFTVEWATKADFTNARRAATTARELKIDNLEINALYHWRVKAGETVSPARTFRTEDMAPRLLRVPDVPNVRDLGGRKTLDGKRVRQNMVFRTAGMNANAKVVHAKTHEELLQAKPELKPQYDRLQAQLEAVKNGTAAPEVPYSLKPQWSLFLPKKETLTDADIKALAELKSIPETFLDAPRQPIVLLHKRHEIPDPVDRAPSVFMTEFESPADGEMLVEAGADWYWAFYINGLCVFDKMDGNGITSPSADNHKFYVPVRKGKNLVAVPLLSGGNGWVWCCDKADNPKGRQGFYERALKNMLKTPTTTEKGKIRLKPEGTDFMLNTLGVRSDIDLRSAGECWGMEGSPLGEKVTWFHYSSSAYAGMQEKFGKSAFTKVFKVFLDEKNYPIAFHCIAGQDRTGSVAFILNGLLNVPEEELYLDWEATGFWNREQDFCHERRFNKLVNGFQKLPGANLNEKIKNYVLSLGFTEEDIAKFRGLMLEDDAR